MTSTSRFRRRFAAVLLLAGAGIGVGALPASADDAPSEQTVVSPDGQWRAKIDAWTTNLVAYKSIGTTVTVQHREYVCTGLFCTGGHQWQWKDRPASEIRVVSAYDPWPPQGDCPQFACPPLAPTQYCNKANTQKVECWSYAFMTGRAQLNAKTVHGNGWVAFPNGQTASLGPVQESFWF